MSHHLFTWIKAAPGRVTSKHGQGTIKFFKRTETEQNIPAANLHHIAELKQDDSERLSLDATSPQHPKVKTSRTYNVFDNDCMRNRHFCENPVNRFNVDRSHSLLNSERTLSYYGNTALHYVAMMGRVDWAQEMLENTSAAERLRLLSMQNNRGETVLHSAVIYGTTEITKCILDSLDETQKGVLMSMRDQFHETALDGAERCGNRDQAQILCDQMNQIHTASEWASESTQASAIRQEQDLSAFFREEYHDRYIIPKKDQACSKIYGLVLYNTHDRQGSEEEAATIYEALGNLTRNHKKVRWSTKMQLETILSMQLEEVQRAGDCALLLVFLMSHGSQGALHASNGRKIYINNMLHQLAYSMDTKETPVVVVVQACQLHRNDKHNDSQDESNDMAQVTTDDLETEKHIVLRRPNTLLITALPGVAARRGAYITALAREIRLANGERSFRDMHQSACRRVQVNNPHQVMVLRDTLNKKIVLPAPSLDNIQNPS